MIQPLKPVVFVFSVVLSFAVCGCSFGFCQDVKPSADVVKESPIVIGTTFHLESKVLGDTREVNVWLPPSYAKGEAAYPVLYLIDGALDQDFQHIAGLGQLTTINPNFEELIVIGIQTKNRFMELTSKPTDPRYIRKPPIAGKSSEFLNFIRTEVIPFAETRFRTGDRKAVLGESLAGLFIAEVFLKAPDTFTDYISVSPSLWWDDKALAKSASELLATHDGNKRQLYVTMADEGGTMQAGLDLVLSAIKENKPAGLTLHYVDRRAAETHSSIYHGAAYDALRKLFGKPSPEYGETPWYLIEGGQPPSQEIQEENKNADQDKVTEKGKVKT